MFVCQKCRVKSCIFLICECHLSRTSSVRISSLSWPGLCLHYTIYYDYSLLWKSQVCYSSGKANICYHLAIIVRDWVEQRHWQLPSGCWFYTVSFWRYLLVASSTPNYNFHLFLVTDTKIMSISISGPSSFYSKQSSFFCLWFD